MATATGPLMSMDASGTVGGAIVFSKWKGRNYVRRHAVPSNPKLPKQVGVRAVLSFLAAQWAALKVTIEPSWIALAEGELITALNAYIKENFSRMRTGRGPTEEYPAAEITTAPSAPTLVATPGSGFCSIAVTKGANAPDWGWLVFAYPVTGSAVGMVNCRLLAAYIASPQTVILNGLTAGTWYFKVQGFMSDGVLGTESAEATAVVT